MRFVITKEYDTVGDEVYRLYLYNLWFKLGFRNSIDSSWTQYRTSILCIEELKETAKKYAGAKKAKAEIIEIFDV